MMKGKIVPEASNFQGLAPKPSPTFYKGPVKKCPTCKGYGRWNIILHAFGENKHCLAPCYSCWGFGWVEFNKVVKAINE